MDLPHLGVHGEREKTELLWPETIRGNFLGINGGAPGRGQQHTATCGTGTVALASPAAGWWAVNTDGKGNRGLCQLCSYAMVLGGMSRFLWHWLKGSRERSGMMWGHQILSWGSRKEQGHLGSTIESREEVIFSLDKVS